MSADALTSERMPHWFVPALVVATALVTGILELPMALFRLALFAKPIEGNAHVLWMAALTNVVLLLPVGVVLTVIAWRWPTARVQRFVTVVLFTIAALALLFYVPRVHTWALFILALGIGVTTARLALSKRAAFQRVVGRLALVLPPLLLLQGFAAAAWTGVHERISLKNLPAAAAGAPNVLLLVLDTVRSISLSLYGYARQTTPFLDQFASSGTVFDHALATSTWTLQSHAGMFTGRYVHELNAGFKTALDDTHPTLAEVLASRGYGTAGFSANRKYVSYEYGLDRGFARFEDFRVSPGQIVVSSALGRQLVWKPWFQKRIGYYDLYGRKNAALVNEGVLRWLERRDAKRPFFAFVNYYDAHDPYLPPAPFDRRFTQDTMRFRPLSLSRKMTPEELERERAAYEGAIAYLDRQLQLLLGELETRGLLANTIVIVTSDHGEQFGEHGLMDHGNSLYRVLQEVPLVLRWPGRVPAGARIAEPVTLRDLPATVLELTGATESPLPGRSLSAFWREASDSLPPASPLLSQLSWPNGWIAHAVRLNDHEYIDWFAEESLYELATDASELKNLLASPDSAQLVTPFRTLKQRLVGDYVRKPELNWLRQRLSRLVP